MTNLWDFGSIDWKSLSSSKLWQTFAIVLPIAALLLLAAMLAYPFGYDQSTFSVAGERVARFGAVPYRDFIDTKPPIIFYLYALNYLIFGHHIWSIRAFDLIYMLVTAWYFRRLIIRWNESNVLATIAQFLLVLHYASSGYWMTAQCESFAFLPTLVLIDLAMRSLRNPQSKKQLMLLGVGIGLLSQFLFLLKFTFVAAPIAVGLWMLLSATRAKMSDVFVLLGFAVLTFLVTGIGYVGWMVAIGGYDRMIEAIRWLQGYAAIEPHWSTNALSLYYQGFPSNYVLAFSFALSLIGLIGMVAALGPQRDGSSATPQKQFLHLIVLVQLLSLAGVLYEKKFFLYHFGRAFITESILEAVAILALIPLVVYLWKKLRGIETWIGRTLGYVLAGAALIAILFFSSFSGIASQTLTWLVSRAQHVDVTERIQSSIERYYPHDQKLVAQFLKPRMMPDDQVFLWGNDQGLYFELDRVPQTICLTNTPFATTWTPTSWKNTLLSQLQQNAPRYIILEWGDTRDYITDAESDSYHLITRLPALVSYIESNYKPLATVGHFMIYEKE